VATVNTTGELSRKEAANQANALYRIDEERSTLHPQFQFSKLSILKSNRQKKQEIEAGAKRVSI
jgi:hypothetical protein